MDLHLHTIAERPDLEAQVQQISVPLWPEFLHHDPIANAHWSKLFRDFPDCQTVLCAGPNEVVAVAHSIPMYWDGTLEDLPDGWDDAFIRAASYHDNNRQTTALLGLAVVIVPDYRSKGISKDLINAMKSIAASRGLLGPVIPVRPTLKNKYPLTPIEHYITWRREDGTPFDPWLRTHWRLGARILRPAPKSMVIPGTVAQWEKWANMSFPESGPYIVEGALSPVDIDLEADSGVYVEPNVWVLHPSNGESSQLSA